MIKYKIQYITSDKWFQQIHIIKKFHEELIGSKLEYLLVETAIYLKVSIRS